MFHVLEQAAACCVCKRLVSNLLHMCLPICSLISAFVDAVCLAVDVYQCYLALLY